MVESKQAVKPAYTPPMLVTVGSLHELTLTDKKYGHSDGFTFMGVSITNNSP